MRGLYLLWIAVVTLTALFAAGIQSTLERRHLDEVTNEQASTLLTGLEVTAQLDPRKLSSQVSKVIAQQSHPLNAKVMALILCPESLAHHARTYPSGFGAGDSFCQQTKTLGPPRTGVDQIINFQDHHRVYRLRIRELAETENHIAKKLLLLQDVSALKDQWTKSFFRSLLIYLGLALFLLAMGATQVRHLLETKLHDLMTSFSHRKKTTEDTSFSKDKANTWLKKLTKILKNRELIVVANREPYIHQKNHQNEIQVIRPASGLVTALEPILRQSGGLWIAHGSGNADRETSDADGFVQVPPGQSLYSLKRVWLNSEQEQGYYYGFANEGLWPLCHLAHTRPAFRVQDWEYYREVNQKFCDSIPQDKFTSNSVFLIQDYHFALLPQMIRQRARRLDVKAPRIGIFWHIPFPNPEAFGICPWNEELLKGMLGADVVGFHTQYHCNNFLETCNRYLEARVDQDQFSVTIGQRTTRVRAFPIGIDPAPVPILTQTEILNLRKKYGIFAEKVAVGVDRVDYTKGLLERVVGVERFLEKYPQWVGKFTLAQMGSPSRTQIAEYQSLTQKLIEAVDRVNQRFTDPTLPHYRAIVLLPAHHDWEEIQYFYQLGDICIVSSLHDGMNLVAKEYVWCQSSERGALILSKFAGASRELTEALIINPYSVEEIADAIDTALHLTPAERNLRMRIMKEKIHSRSSFQWATELISSVSETSEVTLKYDQGEEHRA